MSVSVQTVEIDASSEDIFDLIHDYDRRLDWDPFLRRADLLNGAAKAGIGVSSLCVAGLRSGGLGMETVYVSFQRPAVAAVKMTRGPWFFRSFAASIRQEAVDSGRTRVSYKLNLRARPRWLAGLLEPLLVRVMSHETGRRLRSLKAFMEGEPR